MVVVNNLVKIVLILVVIWLALTVFGEVLSILESLPVLLVVVLILVILWYLDYI